MILPLADICCSSMPSRFAIVKLVVPAVFQRTVGVDTGFMGKGIGSNAGLVYGMGTPKLGYVIGKLLRHSRFIGSPISWPPCHARTLSPVCSSGGRPALPLSPSPFTEVLM